MYLESLVVDPENHSQIRLVPVHLIPNYMPSFIFRINHQQKRPTFPLTVSDAIYRKRQEMVGVYYLALLAVFCSKFD